MKIVSLLKLKIISFWHEFLGWHYKNEIFNKTKTIQDIQQTGIDTAKTASKKVVQKTAEATGDLIGNKLADKITSLGKTKYKEKEKEEERQEICIQ